MVRRAAERVGAEALGAGEFVASAATGGAASFAGGLNYLGTLAASRDPKAAEAVRQETTERLTYQPKTQYGKENVKALGNVMETLVEKPTEFLGERAREGAQTLGASPEVAGAVGATVKTAGQAIPFVAGGRKAVGAGREGALERYAGKVEDRAAVRAAEEAPKQAKISQARSIGLKLPPSEAGGPVGKALEGAGGKIQTEMSLSRANSKVINRTAGKEIGLSERQPLTEANIERQKKAQFAVYDRVRKAGRIEADDGYREALGKVKERTAQEATDFPEDTNELIDKEIKKFDVPVADAGSFLGKIKSLRERAGRNMKSPDAEKFELGLAQKKIATAMEDLIERRVGAKDPALISDFRAARTQLAKIYNVEDALSPNGNVSAAVLARQLKRGVPLSGGLKTIAETYQEFPKVMRYVDALGGHAPFSALDYLVGGVEAAVRPEKAATIVGALALRPAARAVIKSEPYQRAAIKAREPSTPSRAAAARSLSRSIPPNLRERYGRGAVLQRRDSDQRE